MGRHAGHRVIQAASLIISLVQSHKISRQESTVSYLHSILVRVFIHNLDRAGVITQMYLRAGQLCHALYHYRDLPGLARGKRQLHRLEPYDGTLLCTDMMHQYRAKRYDGRECEPTRPAYV
jgi:hypothetical protein